MMLKATGWLVSGVVVWLASSTASAEPVEKRSCRKGEWQQLRGAVQMVCSLTPDEPDCRSAIKVFDTCQIEVVDEGQVAAPALNVKVIRNRSSYRYVYENDESGTRFVDFHKVGGDWIVGAFRSFSYEGTGECDETCQEFERWRKAGADPSAIGLPVRLSRADISMGMSRVRGAMSQCGEANKAEGVVKLKMAIGGDGLVSQLAISEAPAGLQACLDAAIRKHAKFRPSSQGMSITYPLVFRGPADSAIQPPQTAESATVQPTGQAASARGSTVWFTGVTMGLAKSSGLPWDPGTRVAKNVISSVSVALASTVNPAAAVGKVFAEMVPDGIPRPDVAGKAELFQDGVLVKAWPLNKEQDSFTPQWSDVKWENIDLARARLRITLVDKDFRDDDPAGIVEVGAKDLQRAFEAGTVLSVNVADQSGNQVLFVRVSVM